MNPPKRSAFHVCRVRAILVLLVKNHGIFKAVKQLRSSALTVCTQLWGTERPSFNLCVGCCRWRRKRHKTCIVDEAKKLAKYNFFLNRQDNGGYREIMVPIPQNPILKFFGASNKLFWPLSDSTVFPQRRSLDAAPRRSQSRHT